MRSSHRTAFGGLLGAFLATGVGLLLAGTSGAAPPTLVLTATDAEIGQKIHAIAQLSEGSGAPGEVSFEVFGPADPTCSGPELTPAPDSASVEGDGEYSSGEFTPPEAGTYHWSAHYSDDLESADSTCSAVSTVTKASPALTGDASDGLVNTPIHDEVTLSGGFSPSGEVTFKVFGPTDTGCLVPLETAAVPLQGNDATAPDFVPQQAGEFRWTADYPGDANNEPASLECNAVTQTSAVAKASPTLEGTATSTVGVGSSITDTVTLSSGFDAGGQLVFRAFGPDDQTCGTGPKYEEAVTVNGNGSYSPVGFTPAAGSYRWTVEYTGDGNNESASLICGAANQTSTVDEASPSLEGTATPSVTVGTTITDSVSLTGGFLPGGQLIFRAFGPGDQNCASAVKYEEAVAVSGNGSYSPAGFAPGPGSYRWTVEYTGDGNNDPIDLACGAANQTSSVNKASPTLSGAATSATVGTAIADSVTLSGAFSPTGQVTFKVFGPTDTSCLTPLKTVSVPLQGAQATSGTFLPQQAGEFRWTADYPGDANNEPVSLTCNAVNQTSAVAKASPTLEGTATSVVGFGDVITDIVSLSGGFEASGQLIFRAFGPNDPTCGTDAIYEEAVAVSGNQSYLPAGFEPEAGLYQWTVEYEGDDNNEAASLACGTENQASAVGPVPVSLTGSATSGTVGTPITAAASIQEGAIPAGQITFKAFPPADANCSGAPSFSSTVGVAGNGSYRSASFVPSRVGTFRWTVGYSGDVNHDPASIGCGSVTSSVAQARPTIAGQIGQGFVVGAPFSAAATLQGGFAPAGTITFRIYGPAAANCAKPLSVDTIAISGNGTFRSDPFVPQRPGRYLFVAGYSGDTANLGVSETCPAGQVAEVQKRRPKVKPRARMSGKRISIRAHLSGALSPSGAVTFRLYGPGNNRCKGKPAFNGGIGVTSNGNHLLAKYLATRSGAYRLTVGYSGDMRNRRAEGNCANAQLLHVG